MKNYHDTLEAILDSNEELYRAYGNWSRCDGATDLKDHFCNQSDELVMLCELIELCHYLAREKMAA